MGREYKEDQEDRDNESWDLDSADLSRTTETAEAASSREDSAEARSVSSRKSIRDQLQHDIEAFLNHGGAIHMIDPHVMADPPRKPSREYGSRPI